MRLFGQPKRVGWDIASREIATALSKLRKEFYERCIEALDWNSSRGVIAAPRSRTLPSSSVNADLGVIAYQMWVVRAASSGRHYVETKNEEAFFRDLGPRVSGDADEVTRQFIISHMLRFHEVHEDPQVQAIQLGSFLASYFYPEDDSAAHRHLACQLFARVVPSFYLRLDAAVARAFGDLKTAKQVERDIGRVRAAGSGY